MEKLINKKVIHKNFGMGIIIETINHETGIIVKFDALSESKKFQFPEAFENFLRFEDESLQEESITLLKEKKRIEYIEKEQSRIEHEKEYEQYRKEQLEIQRSMRKRPNSARKAKKA